MNHATELTSSDHERALAMLTRLRVEGPTAGKSDIHWLDAHLAACDECAENSAELFSGVRGPAAAITCGAELVRSTQRRLRARARQLDRQRERALPLRIAAAAALGWTVVSTPLLWEAFSHLGHSLEIPRAAWQSGFAFSWLAPTALIAVAALTNRERRTS